MFQDYSRHFPEIPSRRPSDLTFKQPLNQPLGGEESRLQSRSCNMVQGRNLMELGEMNIRPSLRSPPITQFSTIKPTLSNPATMVEEEYGVISKENSPYNGERQHTQRKSDNKWRTRIMSCFFAVNPRPLPPPVLDKQILLSRLLQKSRPPPEPPPQTPEKQTSKFCRQDNSNLTELPQTRLPTNSLTRRRKSHNIKQLVCNNPKEVEESLTPAYGASAPQGRGGKLEAVDRSFFTRSHLGLDKEFCDVAIFAISDRRLRNCLRLPQFLPSISGRDRFEGGNI